MAVPHVDPNNHLNFAQLRTDANLRKQLFPIGDTGTALKQIASRLQQVQQTRNIIPESEFNEQWRCLYDTRINLDADPVKDEALKIERATEFAKTHNIYEPVKVVKDPLPGQAIEAQPVLATLKPNVVQVQTPKDISNVLQAYINTSESPQAAISQKPEQYGMEIMRQVLSANKDNLIKQRQLQEKGNTQLADVASDSADLDWN